MQRLSTKISVAIVGVLLLALASSGAALVTAWQVGDLMEGAAEKSLPKVRAAEGLELALLEQQGWILSYTLEPGKRDWLAQLEARKPPFERWLREAEMSVRSEDERRVLGKLRRAYDQYDLARNEVVRLFSTGDVEQARTLMMGDASRRYEEVYSLCKDYIAANMRSIEDANSQAQRRIRIDTLLVAGSVALTLVLGSGLFWLFYSGVLRPLRAMLAEAKGFTQLVAGDAIPSDDEPRAVGAYLRLLMSDVADARSTLEHSRERLLQAEKLASVGKLAASVAHEIRNPLTSIKMWLFWLRTRTNPAPDALEGFDTVAREIDRLEHVVRNFLEFTRPPPLTLQPCRLSELIDGMLQLISHRLEECRISVRRTMRCGDSVVMADRDQFKQVLINLLDNAVEAMPAGGRIELAVDREPDNSGTEMAVVRVSDSGPGVPDDVARRIFDPFFSTKEDGTGLGLCIAANILARHNGRLALQPGTTAGATFVVALPLAEERA
ncbi:MAG TPA: ATP-binding protein [Pirellulales bacterium]|nr:ATP-binding protein [Pirellulales bacterium]